MRQFLARTLSLLGLLSSGVTQLLADASLAVQLPEDHFPLLEEILRQSAELSPRMIEEDLRVEESRADSKSAAASRWPRVSGAFRYLGRIEDRSDLDGTGSYYEPQGTLVARQPLYHWGALRAGHRVGTLGADLAEESREEVYQIQVQEIRGTFLELAVRQKEIAVARERFELAHEEVEAARNRVRRGESTGEEVDDFVLAQEEARLRLERAEQERNFAREKFARISGFAPAGSEWLPDSIPVLNAPTARRVRAENRNPVWRKIAELRVERAEEQVEVESTRHLPKLDFIAGMAQDQIAVMDRSDVDRMIYFAGLEMTWNLFDGHESRSRKAAAEARRELELRRKERLSREAEMETERLQQALAWANTELKLEEKRLELARRALSQKEADFERGTASAVEVGAARVAVREQELVTTERRAASLMAGSELLAIAGADPALDYLK